jgi:DNA-binding transcriptional LysR family regulator
LGKSVVSIHVSQLEKNLNCQLLLRSGRSIALTQQGRRFYDKCKQIVELAEAARQEIDAELSNPAGRVRVSCPVGFGENVFCKLIPPFQKRYPNVQIEFLLDNSFVDLIEENIDLAIRIGEVEGTDLRTTRIGEARGPLVASREWVHEFSVETPEDLIGKQWIAITPSSETARLVLRHRSGREKTVELSRLLVTNGGGAAKSLILQRVGLGPLPDYMIVDDLKAGNLVQLLPDWEVERPRPISLVFADLHHIPARTRALIDFIKSNVRDHLPVGLNA